MKVARMTSESLAMDQTLEPGEPRNGWSDSDIQEVKGVDSTGEEETILNLGSLGTSDEDSTSDQILKEIAPPLCNEIGVSAKDTSLENPENDSQSDGVLPINSANEAFDMIANNDLLNAEGNECREKRSPLILHDSSPINDSALKSDNHVVPYPVDINFSEKGDKSKTCQETTCSMVIFNSPDRSSVDSLKLDSGSPCLKEEVTKLGQKEHGEELSNCSCPLEIDFVYSADTFSIPILVEYPKNVVYSDTIQRTYKETNDSGQESGNEAFDRLCCTKADANSVGIPDLNQVDCPSGIADNIMIGKTDEEENESGHTELSYDMPESSCSVKFPTVVSAISVQYNAGDSHMLGKMGEEGVESGHQELGYELAMHLSSARISVAAGASTIPLQVECLSDLLNGSVEGQTDGQTESGQQESRNEPCDSSFIKTFDVGDHVVTSTMPPQSVALSDITGRDMKKIAYEEEIESGQLEPIYEPAVGLCTVDTNFADCLLTPSDPAQLNHPGGLDASNVKANNDEDMPASVMYNDTENSEEKHVHIQFHEPANTLVFGSSKTSGMQEDPSKIAEIDELHTRIMCNEPGKNIGEHSFLHVHDNTSSLEEGNSWEAIEFNCIRDEAAGSNEARLPFITCVPYASEIEQSTEKIDESAEAPEREEFKSSPRILKEELEDQKSTSDDLVVSSVEFEAKLIDGFDVVGQHDLAAASKSPRQWKTISDGPDPVIVSVQQEDNKELTLQEIVSSCVLSRGLGRDGFNQITLPMDSVVLDSENGSCFASPEDLDTACTSLAGESNQYVGEDASCTERDEHANAEMPQSEKGLANNEPARSLELTHSDAASVGSIYTDMVTEIGNLHGVHNDIIGEYCKQPESDTNPECTTNSELLLDVEEIELKRDLQLTENSLNETNGTTITLGNTCSAQSNLFSYIEENLLEGSVELLSGGESECSPAKAESLFENADLKTRVSAHPSARLVPELSHLDGAVCLESNLPALDGLAGSSMSTQPLVLNSNALAHPSARLVPEQIHPDGAVCLESNLPALEGLAGSSMSTQPLVLNSNALEEPKTSFPSEGVDKQLEQQNNVIFLKPEDEITHVSLDASVDPVNQTGHCGPISVSSASTQSGMVLTETDHTKGIQSPMPDGDHVTAFVPAISAEICINGVHLSELPLKNIVELGSQCTSTEFQPFKGTEQSSRPLRSGEITEKDENWSTGKIHTPLKNLLVGVNVESKQRASPANKNSPIKEHNDVADKGHSPKTRVLATAEHSNQPGLKRLVQKEWNSPARFPPANKNAKGKPKGKSQWVPFMCCPSVN